MGSGDQGEREEMKVSEGQILCKAQDELDDISVSFMWNDILAEKHQ